MANNVQVTFAVGDGNDQVLGVISTQDGNSLFALGAHILWVGGVDQQVYPNKQDYSTAGFNFDGPAFAGDQLATINKVVNAILDYVQPIQIINGTLSY